jgi:hypothetical protein
MPATLTVPKNIRESGKIRVRETARQVDEMIDAARNARRLNVILHNDRDGEEVRIRWSLIQAID